MKLRLGLICKKAEREWRKNYLPIAKSLYKDQLKCHHKLIFLEKKNYFSARITAASKTSREIFKIVKEFTSPRAQTPTFTPEASWINQLAFFFADKIRNIQSSFSLCPTVPSDCNTVLGSQCISTAPQLLTFPLLSFHSSLDLLQKIKSGSPSDVCPAFFLVDMAAILNPIINPILNASFQSGLVPSRWKAAHILPLLKKPNLDAAVFANYRPISLLPALSKLAEKHAHTVILSFIEEHGILHGSQSGFRSNMSTETALLEVSESIRDLLDRGGKVMLVLLDLSAAFDTVPHNLLLSRLQGMGFGGTVLKWLSSFLSGRSQSIWLPPFSSAIPPMEVGVPQGSILSPTLFNLFVAPLAAIVESHGARIVSYADDTQLLFTCEKAADFDGDDIRQCLTDVFLWLQRNHLKCNSDKSEVLFFGCPSDVRWKQWWPADMHPPLADVPLAKNLGVKMDSSLSFKQQVLTVVGQCFGILKQLKQFLPFLPLSHRKTIIQALIGSKIDYANVLYLGLPEYLLNHLQIVQNHAARAIFGFTARSHVSCLLHSLHWLPVRKRIQFKTLVLTFKSLYGLGAEYLSKRVCFYNPTRSLRSSSLDLVSVPSVKRSRIGGRSYRFLAAKLWNNMPLSLRQTKDLLVFRKALKTWLYKQ